jgi:PAS domain S-box-containing protein
VDKPISAAELRDKLALLFDKDKAKEAFQRLDSAEILNLIYDTAKIGMCVTDEQGHFVKVNRAYVETYGYDEDELVGQPFTKVLPEDMREYAARVHDDFVHGRSNESSGEWKVKTKSGAVKDVYVTAGRFVTQDGKAFKVTTVEDITDRKRLVDQLQKSLSEKEVLMREIHHRVKNNMNMVSGLLYLQAEALKSAEDAREALFQSINRIKTLALVHEHLYKTEDYSRVSIKEYLESLVADLAGTFESNGNGDGLELTWDVEVENLTMDLDLCITNGLILNELVANAIKHGSEQDTLHISVRLVREGEDVVLTVADNGPGFPDDFSLEDADSLGMQLIYNLMRKLGGSIQIDSTHGAMVSIRYPLLT